MKKLFKKITPSFLIDKYHYLPALLGAFLYGFPSKKLKIVGITGTNGKSTVVNLVSKILEEAGFRVASTSSIEFKIGEKKWPNTLRMTMMGGFQLQRFLRQALEADCQYAVLEVTSEGIKQYRHKFIDFGITVLTNLTPEHIEAHGGFENYKKAKAKIFQMTKKIHVINLDDVHAKYFLKFPAKTKFCYGMKTQPESKKCNFIKAIDPEVSAQGVSFKINNSQFNLKLLGGFSVYNALAAICVGLSQDIPLETLKNALEKIKRMPGRMEEVISGAFKVIVDYAFTPNALKQVYLTLKNNFNPKKMICVLGSCGGGRDKWKRPVLGELAARFCDEIIVTNEDPYDEDPKEIIEQIADGTRGKAKKILDRREAIRTALKLANSGDLVIITGKGCEPCICVAGGRRIPWDDRMVVREELKRLKISLVR